MATRKYSVPFTTVTLDIFEVDAHSPSDAAMQATLARAAKQEPTHSRTTKFSIGTAKVTLADPFDEEMAATPLD